MKTTPIDIYIATIQSDKSSTPAMMGESNIFLLIEKLYRKQVLSYEELVEANIPNIFIYDIPEDKKEFNIETVRKCIVDIDLRPYEGKNIYILRHFDTATIQAQNALLKILEDCPIYAVIILEVENSNSVLETITSRIINLSASNTSNTISPTGNKIIEFYKENKHVELIKALYGFKCTSQEAILILQGVYPYLKSQDMDRCNSAIQSLSSTHENPRSILDVFFL